MITVLQPEGTSLCGQACVAMAAGVPLGRAIEAVGHARLRGTFTNEIIRGLRALGVKCADRRKRVSRAKPSFPKRAMVYIHLPGKMRAHWMLTWDGVMHDPGAAWPDRYPDWKITSYLEIFERTN